MKYIKKKKKSTSEITEKMGLARESGDNKCGCCCNNAMREREREMIKPITKLRNDLLTLISSLLS